MSVLSEEGVPVLCSQSRASNSGGHPQPLQKALSLNMAPRQAFDTLHTALELPLNVASLQAYDALQSALEWLLNVALKQAECALQSALEWLLNVALSQASNSLQFALESPMNVALWQQVSQQVPVSALHPIVAPQVLHTQDHTQNSRQNRERCIFNQVYISKSLSKHKA